MRRRPADRANRSRRVAPIDPDVDADTRFEVSLPTESHPLEWAVLAAIAAGGVIGAESRYGLEVLLPHGADAFPWSTLLVNVSGCLLIGVLMAVLAALDSPHRWARPFLGVGVLGGYTTFSTFAVDVDRLVVEDAPALAAGYLVVTVAAGAVAVWLGAALTDRWAVRGRAGEGE